MALEFPNIDPVALTIGPLQIHWYALAYVFGFIAAWRLAIRICKLAGNPDQRPNENDIDDYISWAILGVLLGGRLGYVLFYNLPTYWENPAEALKVWHGGMSFHGGVIGVVISLVLFSKFKKVPFWRLADTAAAVTPIGFFLGRVANFVNGELFGRVTDISWGVIFPRGGEEPRHPSQLYEAATEGILLFIILFSLIHVKSIRERTGTISALFMLGYGLFRFGCEFFREPDVQLGFIVEQVTMGQILCVPMIVAGLVFYVMAGRKCQKS
jgi:phosphatidylglycerol:prolipoprotein diacylglycerol transferase